MKLNAIIVLLDALGISENVKEQIFKLGGIVFENELCPR